MVSDALGKFVGDSVGDGVGFRTGLIVNRVGGGFGDRLGELDGEGVEASKQMLNVSPLGRENFWQLPFSQSLANAHA